MDGSAGSRRRTYLFKQTHRDNEFQNSLKGRALAACLQRFWSISLIHSLEDESRRQAITQMNFRQIAAEKYTMTLARITPPDTGL
jgi:hypothetical protein